MKKRQGAILFRTYKWILFCLMLLPIIGIGCGGGGGGSNNSGDSNATSVREGVFVDSEVEGLDFETDTQSGKTDEDGTFMYLSGETVEFSIGNTVLGSATGQGTITPVDLVDGATDENDPTVTNIAKLLQGLDQDGDSTNGILITDAIKVIVSSALINFEQATDDFDTDQAVQDMMESLNAAEVFLDDDRDLPTDEEAQEHLGNTLSDIEDNSDDDGGSSGDGSLVAEVQTDSENDGDIDLSRTYTYNSDGTVQRIDFDDNNDGTDDRYSEYTYDSHKNWLTIETELMSFITIAEYTNTYNNNQLIQTDTDNYQQVGGIDIGKGNVDERVTYSYDTNGNKIREDSDQLGNGTIDSVFTFEHDGSGNIIKINQDIDNNGEIDLITTNTYNNDNKLIKVELDGELQPGDDLPDGTPESISTYTYDSSGRIKKLETDYNNDGAIDTVDNYIYE